MQGRREKGFPLEGKKRATKSELIGLLGLLIGILISAPFAFAATAEEGRSIFQQKCASCHTIGGGDLIGPDLAGVTAIRDRDWLARFIANPEKLIAEGDPTAVELFNKYYNVPMPNLNLKTAEIDSLLLYLESQSKGMPGTGTTTPVKLPPGDPQIGKALFTGTMPFENGGPGCMACHNIASVGPVGGGALGPSLSTSYIKFGDAGIASILSRLSFPTMIPVYGERPLTLQEQSHLAAFLKESLTEERPLEGDTFLVYLMGVSGTGGVIGTVILLVISNFFWRSRSKGVRRQLLTQKDLKKGGD